MIKIILRVKELVNKFTLMLLPDQQNLENCLPLHFVFLGLHPHFLTRTLLVILKHLRSEWVNPFLTNDQFCDGLPPSDSMAIVNHFVDTISIPVILNDVRSSTRLDKRSRVYQIGFFQLPGLLSRSTDIISVNSFHSERPWHI
ncbi:hypothetical protein NPIL_291961 [Nephila pilipes]|uniref:Uncharacterized protein n=1 Tax=Nephila pilipes TaxID=299642 RepID=A0A8X6P9L9_NEPPI|nr:hypothetical protein NPIL_291961 [Nephila pilipes]